LHSQSTSRESNEFLHVAIVLDANGRWAERRGLPRSEGHRAGVEAVRRVVAAAPALDVGTLSLFALSSDNWTRPPDEVEDILACIASYVADDGERLAERGIRLSFPGRRDRVPGDVARALEDAERRTCHGRTMRLRIAVDYSARDILMRAARLGESVLRDREAFRSGIALASGESEPVPDVDLFIRSGGERRFSDFLLFESAYAEIEFLDTAWPDFTAFDLEASLRRFRRRERKFGGLPAHATPKPKHSPLERSAPR